MNGHVITIEPMLLHSNMYRVTVVDCDHGYKPEGMEDLRSYRKAYEYAAKLQRKLGYPIRLKSGNNLSIPKA